MAPGTPLRALRQFALVAGALLAGVTALYGVQTCREIRADKLSGLQTVLALTQQSVDHYFLQMQLAMGQLAQDAQAGAGLTDLPRVQRLLAHFALAHPELRAAHLVDMEGQLLASSTTTALTGLPGTAAQRDYVAIRASLRVDQPFVLTHPFVGPVVHQWILPMRYTLRDEAGAAVGFLVAVAPVDMLQGFWQDAPVVANAHIAAIGDDGYLLTRYPLPAGADLAEVYGQPRHGALRQHLLAQHFPRAGTVEGHNFLAQDELVSVFRRLDHFPVTLVVATPASSFQAAWWQRMQFGLLLSALVAALGAWVYRHVQAGQRSAQAAQQQHEQALGQAMDQLAASGLALQQELDGQRDAICRVDAKGCVAFVNLAYCQAFGVARERFTGGTWHGATLAEDVPGVEQQLAAMSPQAPTCLVECRMQMADGSTRWYQWSNHARFDAQGQLQDLQGVGRDITDRKRMEQSLAQAMAEADDLYEHSPQGLHSLGPDGTFLRINDTELAWLGRRRDEVVGKLRWLDVCTADAAAVFDRAFPAFKSGQPIEALGFTLVSADGSTRRVSISATPILDAQGRFVKSRSVVQDMEALRRSEEQTDQLARELAAMLDTELVAVLRVKDAHLAWVNRGAARLFGQAAGALEGQPVSALFGDDPRFGPPQAAPGPAAGPASRFQMPYRAPGGEALWLDVNGVALSADGRDAMWILADITQLKDAEASRLRAVELAAEGRQMREANRLKSVFLANMSHELRTPLNAVIGLSQLLQTGQVAADSPLFDSFVRQIGSSGQQLLGLIDTMLDAMKLDAGRMRFHPVPVDLPQLVAGVQRTLAPELAARQLRLALDLAPELATVTLDPLRLEQVLHQLLSNAIKFSTQVGAIQLRTLPDGPTQFRLEVQDQGIGIAAEDQARLFSDFRQLDEGSTKAYPGTGMGLALVRRLVQAQGGQTGVRSTPGQGSVFFVVLPRQARGDANEAAQAAPASP